MPSTRFVLVRHAHTDAVGLVLAGRAAGFGLNVLGVEAAARLASSLRGFRVAGVSTSSQERARQTAEAIAEAACCEVTEDVRLDEVDFGDFQGRDFTSLEQAPGWSEWNTLRSLAPTPGGESMLQVQARAVSVLQDLHARGTGGTFVLVSHADVVKSVLCYALGSPLDLLQRIEISPASTSEIVLWDNQVRVESVNLRV